MQTMAEPYLIDRKHFEPAYLRLYEAGELKCRVERALEKLADCRLCPRDCGVNRLENKFAVCKTGRYAVVSSHFAHFGEEDCLRGTRGSGTIFFGWCNLRCVFCQNYALSWLGEGRASRPEELARMMIYLQELGCHNINFVTPEMSFRKSSKRSRRRLSAACACPSFITPAPMIHSIRSS